MNYAQLNDSLHAGIVMAYRVTIKEDKMGQENHVGCGWLVQTLTAMSCSDHGVNCNVTVLTQQPTQQTTHGCMGV